MRPQSDDGDRAGNQHLAPERRLSSFFTWVLLFMASILYSRVQPRGEQRVQTIGVGSPIGVGYDLTTFPVICGVGDAPLHLVGWKWNFKLRKKLTSSPEGEVVVS
jgi:hypothetical protein